MVNTKSGAQFAKDESDYKWFNKNTASTIKSYHEQGYKVVIFT
jgi:bifunctional polynucleotide phosphatase/kinase